MFLKAFCVYRTYLHRVIFVSGLRPHTFISAQWFELKSELWNTAAVGMSVCVPHSLFSILTWLFLQPKARLCTAQVMTAACSGWSCVLFWIHPAVPLTPIKNKTNTDWSGPCPHTATFSHSALWFSPVLLFFPLYCRSVWSLHIYYSEHRLVSTVVICRRAGWYEQKSYTTWIILHYGNGHSIWVKTNNNNKKTKTFKSCGQ